MAGMVLNMAGFIIRQSIHMPTGALASKVHESDICMLIDFKPFILMLITDLLLCKSCSAL